MVLRCMTPNPPRRQDRRGLRLRPVGITHTLTFVTAIAIAATMFFAG